METQQQALIRLTNSNGGGLPRVASAGEIVAVRSDRGKYPRLKDISQGVRQEWLAKEFRKFMALARVKEINPREILAGAVALDEMIMSEDVMADLTMPEVSQAFKNGVFGKYGEYYGLTAMSFYGFLTGYLDSDEKRDAAKEMRARADAETAARREAERRRERERMLAEIEDAKRNGFVPSWGPDYRFTPKRVDSIIDSSSHREKVMEQARKILSTNSQK